MLKPASKAWNLTSDNELLLTNLWHLIIVMASKSDWFNQYYALGMKLNVLLKYTTPRPVRGSNPRPCDHESDALPTDLSVLPKLFGSTQKMNPAFLDTAFHAVYVTQLKQPILIHWEDVLIHQFLFDLIVHGKQLK